MKHPLTLLSRVAAPLALVVLLLGAVAPSSTAASASHVQVQFHAVHSSGVSGFADLRQLSGGGTRINVVAFGLKPGANYLSLYYDNHVCALEPYSADDVIGGFYRANSVGVGTTRGTADDDLDEINSVSVRKADFTLVACANVHP
ncbi:MAG TPA: hypothetical protein VH482_26655 [Thermomicrobiales bacterium]|jgi:hypothetical protein